MMKKFIIINLAIALLGILVGIYTWGYIKINPIDDTEYNMFVYYLNEDNKVEQTMLSINIDDVDILLEYYKNRKGKSASQVTLKKDNGSFRIIPLDGKVKLIDTIGRNVVKIQLLYHTKYKELKKINGYVPILNLHSPTERRLTTEHPKE